MKNKSRHYLYIFVFHFLVNLNSTSGYSQDHIKLVTGEELQVKIHDRNGRTLSYSLQEEDSGKLHVLSRKSIKWFRYEYLTRKRVSFSISFGGTPYGTANSIKKYMKDNGYAGTSSGWFGTTEYPVSHVKMPVLVEVEYLMKPPHGISIEFAASNHGSVVGYSESGIHSGSSNPEIFFNNPQFSFSYKLYAKSMKSALQAGFILNTARIKEVESDFLNTYNIFEDSQLTWGILIGYTGGIVEQQTVFIRFQTQLRYVSPVSFDQGDFLMSGEKIGLTQFFVGLQMGVKLYPDKS